MKAYVPSFARIGGAQRCFQLILLYLLFLSTQSTAAPHPHAADPADATSTCPVSPFDYSVKIRSHELDPVCEALSGDRRRSLSSRQLTDDDYSCSESKPCSNGACCSKKTGYCNYGPDACGPNGVNNVSPNDVCWSNCNAVAECGRYAATAGAKCPLNVCCSEYGFCGMTADFCTTASDDTGCQSNCEQPGSGATGSDVQSRVIGYYEAWAHDRSCSGMDFKDIPVGGLTHLHFSFGYISPGDFKVAPMDGLPESLFNDLTDLKQKNVALKTIVALGGWTFTDPGATQTVFSEIVSSPTNRKTFIDNLLSFLREYAFDGVDFDWEYPGAPDRGGQPDDGPNFTQLLSELKDAISNEPLQYVVSFTVPTSYWYLRWFDLKAIDHVDWVNVMSYDLHGTWDSTNPIGSHVLAHTNLTEIEQAFDLFWRNGVDPSKLNLGIGFYGRSFQLSDPSCYQPGCNFKGGASPGPCTANSGTLSYQEIIQIISQNNLQPYYDKTAAVKYIVWNQDQWVSYDDKDTFKQKIDFANNLGLGGVLIWSVDQDTEDLQALQALLAPKSITGFADKSKDASYWQNATSADCYVTDCGGSCSSGFIPIETQPCGGAKPVTRHAKGSPSTLCCPVTAAPDPKKCTWRGDAPSCNGRCHDNEVGLEQNRWGSGKYCEDGNKIYCCEVPDAKSNNCYWTGVGGNCNSGDEALTFAGTFLETIADIIDIFPPTLIGEGLTAVLDGFDMDLRKLYCCPPDDMKKWTNCAWHGQPGSCGDNQCDLGHQVQLATSAYGLGQSCFPRLERDRVFCCDPTSGQSPFLPVPLADLFPSPPTGDPDTDYELNVDNTWGTGQPKTGDKQPDDAAFAFVVLASPEELQISLSKRDGSHWEVFNCNDAVSEEAQTVQMFCSDISETSNCHKIHLGHGVPGTILEMPTGCGPSKYAVAKSLEISANQTLPYHLAKRDYGHRPVVYDLTFDFEWHRVPRDLGDTQMRVDYSNEVGYWDTIVNGTGASKRRRKRSLEEMGGNHKRWLEEEWRDDMHFGGLSTEELHKRWFGSSIISWLQELFSPSIKQDFTHNIDTTFTAKLIDESLNCDVGGGVNVQAKLLAQALANVKVATSFGFTLIAKLTVPPDLSQSYLYFKNKGEVTAVFTIDALVKATFTTGDIELLGLQNFPGATFGIPKLLTIGPNFRLFGAVNAEMTVSGHVESRVNIASWEVQQTYPDQSSEYNPKALDVPDYDGTGSFEGIQQPTFDYSVAASGYIEAHLKPTFEFGIVFDPIWQVGAARADIVADGWVRLSASTSVTSTETCPFSWDIDVGADLYATLEAPSAFGWSPQNFPIASLPGKTPLKDDNCQPTSKRNFYEGWDDSLFPRQAGEEGNLTLNRLDRRAGSYGPLLSLPKTGCLFCPKPKSDETSCEDISGWEPSDLDDPSISTRKRDLGDPSLRNVLVKRADKDQSFCIGYAKMMTTSPPFQSSGDIVNTIPQIPTYGFTNPTVCNDFGIGRVAVPAGGDTIKFATEHVLEFQLVKIFLDAQNDNGNMIYPDLRPNKAGMRTNLCTFMQQYWYLLRPLQWPTVNGATRRPLDQVTFVFPGQGNAWQGEFVLLSAEVNHAKERMWGVGDINSLNTMSGYTGSDPDKAIKNMKDVIAAYKYHIIPAIDTILVNQKTRVGDMFQTMETALTKITPTDRSGNSLGYSSYVAQDLRGKWNTFMKARTDLARTKAETYLDEWYENLSTGYATATQRQQADAERQTLIGKIDAIGVEIANIKNTWINPF